MLRRIVEFIKKIFCTEPVALTVSTLHEAIRELEIAQNHFENCEPEYVSAAIFELNAAECRLNAMGRSEALNKANAITIIDMGSDKWFSEICIGI